MSQEKVWLVFSTGRIKAGHTREEVLARLVEVKGVNIERATKLLNGKPVIIKKGLDETASFRAKTFFEKIGLEVAVKCVQQKRPDSLSGLSLVPKDEKETLSLQQSKPPSVDDAENVKKTLKPGYIECQKCKEIQKNATECVYCGVIISRYIQKMDAANNRFSHSDESEDNEHIHHPSLSSMIPMLTGIAALTIILIVFIFINNRTSLPEIGDTPEAIMQINAVREENNLERPDVSELKNLLVSGKYQQLESLLRDLNDKVTNDITWEYAFLETVNNFSKEQYFSEDMLTKWVQTTGSPYAYICRANYYIYAGDEARGDLYASQTTARQFSMQAVLHKKARSDLLKAKRKDKSLLPIYSFLIAIGTSQGMNMPLREYLNEAIEEHPGGYHYRYVYLKSKMPKWGGSYTAMREFIDETKPYYHYNPRLWLLQGFVSGEKGRRAMDDKDNELCIKHYTDALQVGINSDWLRNRAYCLVNVGDYEAALLDVNLSLEIVDSDFARQLKQYLKSKI